MPCSSEMKGKGGDGGNTCTRFFRGACVRVCEGGLAAHPFPPWQDALSNPWEALPAEQGAGEQCVSIYRSLPQERRRGRGKGQMR